MLVAVTFCRSLGNGFVWDDLPVIVENPLVQGHGGITGLLTAEDTIAGMTPTGYYRPLTYLSFYVDQQLWGGRAAGFHAINLMLHAGVALILYRLLVSLTVDAVVALFATLLFALNPVTVEAVCFISGGRNTILCTLFALLALSLHRRGASSGAALCTMAAAASKEAGFLLPLVLFAHDVLLERKRRDWRVYGVLVLPLMLLLAVRVAVVSSNLSPPLSSGTLLLVPELILRYIYVTIMPLFHRVAYLFSPPPLLSLRFAGGLAGCCLLGILCLRQRHNRLFLFGAAWFLLFLLPAVSLATRYKLPMADRHAYLPAIGLCLAAAALSHRLTGLRLAALPVLLTVLFAVQSFMTVPVWKSNGTLFTRMLQDEPRAETGYTELASYHLHSGDLAGAEAVIDRGEKAGAVPSGLARFIRLGMLCTEAERLLAAGRVAEAERLILQVLQREPDFVPALIDAGSIAARRGDLREAVRLFSRAAEIQPDDATPRYNLAEAYRLLGDQAAAMRELSEYRRLTAAQRQRGAR